MGLVVFSESTHVLGETSGLLIIGGDTVRHEDSGSRWSGGTRSETHDRRLSSVVLCRVSCRVRLLDVTGPTTTLSSRTSRLNQFKSTYL